MDLQYMVRCERVGSHGRSVCAVTHWLYYGKIILNIIRTQQRTNLIVQQAMLTMIRSDPQQEVWLSMMEPDG